MVFYLKHDFSNSEMKISVCHPSSRCWSEAWKVSVQHPISQTSDVQHHQSGAGGIRIVFWRVAFERGNTEMTRNLIECISGIYNFTKYVPVVTVTVYNSSSSSSSAKAVTSCSAVWLFDGQCGNGILTDDEQCECGDGRRFGFGKRGWRVTGSPGAKRGRVEDH